MFKEDEHPRDNDGKFTDKNGGGKSGYDSRNDLGTIKNATKKTLAGKIVKVDMDADIQKQLSQASTPKERQKIAYRYIMDNLCGEYDTADGRTVTISSVGADKITHKDIEVKLRVSPHLAEFLKAGELEKVIDAEHRKFTKFAYYKVDFQLGQDRYTALLNVGVRRDGTSTLYDINPFNKQ